MKTIVTMRHMRQLGYCSAGVRRFFEKHNFSYSDFLKNGIDADKLAGTGDQMAIDVSELAKNGR